MSRQCQSLTKQGNQCSRSALPLQPYCWQHMPRRTRILGSGLIAITLALLGILANGIEVFTFFSPAQQEPNRVLLVSESELIIIPSGLSTPEYVEPAPFYLTQGPIQRVGDNLKWTLSWDDLKLTEGTRYIIEESDSPSFQQLTDAQETTAKQTQFIKPLVQAGTHYYRLKLAQDSDTTIDSIVVRTRYDTDFSELPLWKIVRERNDNDATGFVYDEGQFGTPLQKRFNSFIATPLVAAPPIPYRIEARFKWKDPIPLVSAGMVFGANGSVESCRMSQRETVSNAQSDQLPLNGCFDHYYRLIFVAFNISDWEYNPKVSAVRARITRVDYHNPTNGGLGETILEFANDIPAREWNTLRIDVSAQSDISIFLNEMPITTFRDATYTDQPLWGVFTASDEYVGDDAAIVWDHVVVEPLE